MPSFEIRKDESKAGVVVLTPRGYLDAHTYEELEKTFHGLFESGKYRVVVDLGGLDYISSAGAGVFIGAIPTAQENGGNVVLVRPTPNVKEVFDLLGLSQVFTFKSTTDEAARTFK